METPLRKGNNIDPVDQFIKAVVPAFPALPSVKALAGRRQRDEWIWDSGSTNDLIGIQDVKLRDLDNKTLLHSPVVLDTAGGEETADSALPMHCSPLREDICPLLMPKGTPKVLSCGMRCVELGYGFWWAPYSEEPEIWIPIGGSR